MEIDFNRSIHYSNDDHANNHHRLKSHKLSVED